MKIPVTTQKYPLMFRSRSQISETIIAPMSPSPNPSRWTSDWEASAECTASLKMKLASYPVPARQSLPMQSHQQTNRQKQSPINRCVDDFVYKKLKNPCMNSLPDAWTLEVRWLQQAATGLEYFERFAVWWKSSIGNMLVTRIRSSARQAAAFGVSWIYQKRCVSI